MAPAEPSQLGWCWLLGWAPNTITLTDCCATTSAEGHKGATEGTFGMFSSPMTGEEFLKKINA